MLLVLVGAVADLAQAMDEDGPREAVARFAFVELLAGLTPQFSIFQPIEGEQRAFRPSRNLRAKSDAKESTLFQWVVIGR